MVLGPSGLALPLACFIDNMGKSIITRNKSTQSKYVTEIISVSRSVKGLVINYGEGGGATKWENRRSETFCAPPLKTG